MAKPEPSKTPKRSGATGLTYVTNRQSKLGQGRLVAAHRVAIAFYFRKIFDTDIDLLESDFNGAVNASDAASADGSVGIGYANRAKVLTLGGRNTGDPSQILCGAGWQSVNANQRIAVSQEKALGHFELIETVSHSVDSNSLRVSKMALRHLRLDGIGIAPWGKDVLESAALDAYIFDPKELQRGNNFGWVKAYGLHIEDNSFESNVGRTAMENVTFRVDRFQKGNRKLPKGMLKELKTTYPELYSDIEVLEQFAFEQ